MISERERLRYNRNLYRAFHSIGVCVIEWCEVPVLWEFTNIIQLYLCISLICPSFSLCSSVYLSLPLFIAI